jgi:hypothetical protein
MSNNFTNNRTKKVLNYRDMDQLVFELSTAIISQTDTTTYYQNLKKGLVLDNWGADLYRNDNLQDKFNKSGIEYFVTFALDADNSDQLSHCNTRVVYDFSILLRDQNNATTGSSKQRLTRIVDLFIESIVNNDTNFLAEIETAVDPSTLTLKEKSKYSCPLRAAKLIRRIGTISEKVSKYNYLTCNLAIQFLIKKIY